jgi:hypothetical protein
MLVRNSRTNPPTVHSAGMSDKTGRELGFSCPRQLADHLLTAYRAKSKLAQAITAAGQANF